MRKKLIQIGPWFIRLDMTILSKFNVLLGFNYCEGIYRACKDSTLTDCMLFEYAEFQIGLLFLTFAIGKEYLLSSELEGGVPENGKYDS